MVGPRTRDKLREAVHRFAELRPREHVGGLRGHVGHVGYQALVLDPDGHERGQQCVRVAHGASGGAGTRRPDGLVKEPREPWGDPAPAPAPGCRVLVAVPVGALKDREFVGGHVAAELDNPVGARRLLKREGREGGSVHGASKQSSLLIAKDSGDGETERRGDGEIERRRYGGGEEGECEGVMDESCMEGEGGGETDQVVGVDGAVYRRDRYDTGAAFGE